LVGAAGTRSRDPWPTGRPARPSALDPPRSDPPAGRLGCVCRDPMGLAPAAGLRLGARKPLGALPRAPQLLSHRGPVLVAGRLGAASLLIRFAASMTPEERPDARIDR